MIYITIYYYILFNKSISDEFKRVLNCIYYRKKLYIIFLKSEIFII